MVLIGIEVWIAQQMKFNLAKFEVMCVGRSLNSYSAMGPKPVGSSQIRLY